MASVTKCHEVLNPRVPAAISHGVLVMRFPERPPSRAEALSKNLPSEQKPRRLLVHRFLDTSKRPEHRLRIEAAHRADAVIALEHLPAQRAASDELLGLRTDHPAAFSAYDVNDLRVWWRSFWLIFPLVPLAQTMQFIVLYHRGPTNHPDWVVPAYTPDMQHHGVGPRVQQCT